MKTRLISISLCIFSLLFLINGGSAAPGTTPLGDSFTYQGYLERSGTPFTGACDFRFRLYDAETDGTLNETEVTLNGLAIIDGRFSAELDFGSGAFDGNARWLEVRVQCPGDSSPTTFPRQELTAAPYALYAKTAPWGGLMDIPAGFADNVDDGTTYEGSCGVGSTIHSIHPDGSFDCREDAVLNRFLPPSETLTTTLDSAGTTGRYSAATIGTDGLGLISYNDYEYGDLKVAHCTDTTCSAATLATLDSSGNVGFATSIVIGVDGLGLISYWDDTNTAIKVAHCDDTACTTADIFTVDPDHVGRSSITIGSDGYGLIGFCAWDNNTLRVVHCSDTTCSSSTSTAIDSSGDGCAYSSTTVGIDGLGLIAYGGGNPTYDLKVAHCSNNNCSTATLITLDSSVNVGEDISITTGTDGLGLISYYDFSSGNLKVAHCDNVTCSVSTITTLESTGDVGSLGSIAIGLDGFGVISYYDATNHYLKLANCKDVRCTSAAITTVGSSMIVVDPTSLTIGIDGNPLISTHSSSADLLVTHCSNPLCIPYFRRR